MMRRLAELDRVDARHGLGAHPLEVPRARPARQRYNSLIAAFLTVGVLGAVVMLDPGGVATSTRALLGLDPAPPYQVPLLDPGEGSYTYMRTQPGSDQPVTWDPCRKIRVVVNPEGAPRSWESMVETAIDHVSGPSGLRFDLVGETDERPSPDRPARDPDRYGGGWAPVLDSWADEDEVPGLAGDVAGLGGGTSITELGRSRYVTGTVTLDRDAFAGISARPDAGSAGQAIVDHEFGHLVGLGHVDDSGELMSEQNRGRTTWGPGDLAGLSRLGRGRCS
jgi:hypothetical protein